MIEYALSLNVVNRVVAFLWDQGEHEAVLKNEPENYIMDVGYVKNYLSI